MQILILTLALAAGALAAPQFQQQQQLQQQQKPIAILKLANDVQPDGSYTWEYETENKIQANARGILNNAGSENEAIAVQGAFSFVADDGQTYTVTYIADENGFQPQGAHLPVPPPIPEEILKSLEYNAAHPEEDEEKSNKKF